MGWGGGGGGDGGYRRSSYICSHRMCGNKHDVEEWGEDALSTFDKLAHKIRAHKFQIFYLF